MSDPVAALNVLHFTLGQWRVHGVLHGHPVRGDASAGRSLDGSLIEYRERVILPSGVCYTDLCLYRADPTTLDVQVHHFSEGGSHAVHTVLPLDGGGLHWVPHDMGPRVRLIPEPEGWRTEVWESWDATEPDVVLHYRSGP